MIVSYLQRTIHTGFQRLFALAWALATFFLVEAQVVTTYTSDGTFVVPPGVTELTVECWGAGGRGGTRTTSGSPGGGGGGG